MHGGVVLPLRLDNLLSIGLPHACGGVSAVSGAAGLRKESSPCMWGCFRLSGVSQRLPVVFPMHVGVFPAQAKVAELEASLPHACGGVSLSITGEWAVSWSSPCMWGCFSS